MLNVSNEYMWGYMCTCTGSLLGPYTHKIVSSPLATYSPELGILSAIEDSVNIQEYFLTNAITFYFYTIYLFKSILISCT